MQPLDCAEIEPVAFAQTMRHIGAHISTQPPEERHIDTGRHNPVDIVVAIKTNRLPSRDRAMQPFDRLLHIGNQKGIMRRL
ncbi:single-stranded-DNA-specific exonuclease RecJ [Nitrospirota bacterium]|nr:single-stranded-DNA-specific exonuclease RecJ [Nitrospirota bacterium]